MEPWEPPIDPPLITWIFSHTYFKGIKDAKNVKWSYNKGDLRVMGPPVC